MTDDHLRDHPGSRLRDGDHFRERRTERPRHRGVELLGDQAPHVVGLDEITQGGSTHNSQGYVRVSWDRWSPG